MRGVLHRPADLRFTGGGVKLRGDLASQGGIDYGSNEVLGVIQGCQRMGVGAGKNAPQPKRRKQMRIKQTNPLVMRLLKIQVIHIEIGSPK